MVLSQREAAAGQVILLLQVLELQDVHLSLYWGRRGVDPIREQLPIQSQPSLHSPYRRTSDSYLVLKC